VNFEGLSDSQVALLLALPLPNIRGLEIDWRTAGALIRRGLIEHEHGGLFFTSHGRAWSEGFRAGRKAACG
jgi:hypothetical protein